LSFKFDPAIFPFLNGDKTPLQYRVPLEEVMELEANDQERIRSYSDFYEKHRTIPAGDTQYTCGAGLSSFHIDPYGHLQPCLMTPHYRYDLLEHGFAAIWNRDVKAMRSRKANVNFACNSCQHKSVCTGCGAFFNLENGTEHVRSQYVCEMTHNRAALMREHQNKTGAYPWCTVFVVPPTRTSA